MHPTTEAEIRWKAQRRREEAAKDALRALRYHLMCQDATLTLIDATVEACRRYRDGERAPL